MKAVFTVGLLVAAARATSPVYSTKLAQNFSYLAAAAYCDAPSISGWTCSHCRNFTGVTSAMVVGATAYGSSLQAYIAQLADGGVVVSYRGTLSNGEVINWFVDVAFRLQNVSMPDCEGCALHEGFLAGVRALQPGVDDALAEFDALHAPAVYVTGHSLGAAMAEIAAFNLLATGYPVTAMYSFGTPRVGNPAWAAAYARATSASNVSSFRVVHNQDDVPHLPPQALGFRHPPREVWYSEHCNNFTVCSATDGEDPSCSDSIRLPDGKGEHAWYLNVSMGC